MGRSVFIEEAIEERILQLFGETKWTSGVLIGQSSPQRDYVIHLALAPSQESEEVSDDVGSDKKGVKQRNASHEFDEEWFVQHCRQVNCMLTGGLRILGIFVFGPPDVRTKLQAKFRQTLYSVHKMICGDFPLAKLKLDQSANQVMVHVCSSTKKISCYTIDVSDTKASIQPADLKYQNFVSKWTRLHCSLALELRFTLHKKADGKTHFSNLKSGMMPILSRIANSLGTIDGTILGDEQLLMSESKQKGKSLDRNLTKKIDLYLTENGFEPDILKDTSRQVLLVGTVESRAFLHPKATVKDAIDAIKCDVVRTLLTRCRLLCEDMDGDEGVEDERLTKWELPKRIFAPMCRGHVSISDCVFKDEDTKDILNRILELLGASVSEEDLVSNETFADHDVTSDQLVQDKISFDNNESMETEADSSTGSTFYRFFGASVGALTVAMAALYQWYLND